MSKCNRRVPFACAATAVMAVGSYATGQPQFEILDLHDLLPPSFEAIGSAALGIEPVAGFVVGSYDIDCGGIIGCIPERVVLWRVCSSAVETPPDPEFEPGQARSINGSNQIVGYYKVPLQLGGTHMRAFRWDRNPSSPSIIRLPTALEQGQAAALDINNSTIPRRVVGRRQESGGTPAAVYWEDDVPTYLFGDDQATACAKVTNEWGALPSALAINDSHVVTGQGLLESACSGSCNSQEEDPVYKWDAFTDTFTGLCYHCVAKCQTLPDCAWEQPLDCSRSRGFDISPTGIIVGDAFTFPADDLRAFYWITPDPLTNAGFNLIQPLPGHNGNRALAVNRVNGSDQVVGVSSPMANEWGGASGPLIDFDHYGDSERRAFLYDITSGRLDDLFTLIVGPNPFNHLVEASEISRDGHIVGWGVVDVNGKDETHAYFLRPVVPCPWDLNGDGCVSIPDLLILLGNWGRCPSPCPPSCPGDFDGDCSVTVADQLKLLGNWGLCP